MTLKEVFKFIAKLFRADRRHRPQTNIDCSKSPRLNPKPTLGLNPNPRFVTTAEDVRSVTVRKYEFYPEDLEKMKTMTPKEVRVFKAQLVRAGRRYYLDTGINCSKSPRLNSTSSKCDATDTST